MCECVHDSHELGMIEWGGKIRFFFSSLKYNVRKLCHEFITAQYSIKLIEIGQLKALKKTSHTFIHITKPRQ